MVRALPVIQPRRVCMDPCPWVSCRWHLRHEAAARAVCGSSWSDEIADDVVASIDAAEETCALAAMRPGGLSHQRIADLMDLREQTVIDTERRATAKWRTSTSRDDFEERDHPEDPYVRYHDMGADELAEIAATLRERAKRSPR